MNRALAERAFLAVVRAAQPIGYGRLIQIISHDWYRRDPEGAALALTSYGLLPPDDRRTYEELAELDPLFADDTATPCPPDRCPDLAEPAALHSRE